MTQEEFIRVFNSLYSYFIYIEKNVHPAIIVWPLAYIVYEFLSVTILRIVHNSGTFKPGKDHLHYEIMKLFNFSQIKTVSIILIVNFFVIILGCYIFTKLGPVVSIAMFILFFVFYLVKILYSKNVKNLKLI